MEAALPTAPAGAEADFDLDISVVEQGPVIPSLLNDTSDNCTATCNSACANSTCIIG